MCPGRRDAYRITIFNHITRQLPYHIHCLFRRHSRFLPLPRPCHDTCNHNRADTGSKLAHNHRCNHLRLNACGKAKMVSQRSGCRDKPGHIDYLPAAAHFFNHAIHRNRISQCEYQAPGGYGIDSQQPSERIQHFVQRPRQQFQHRQDAAQDYDNAGNNLHT